MKVYKNVVELIGKTPLLEAENLAKTQNLSSKLFLKLEYFNPTGSIKDRAAKFMIEDAENKGQIKKGSTIIEPTSGNTGIGLASIGRAKGYRVILTMPSTMSIERVNLLKSYGAEVHLSDGKLGMDGAIKLAEKLKGDIPNSFILGQFTNPANINAHYMETAREIYQDLDGKIDFFVAGVGSAGTITGCAKYFKEVDKNIKVIAVEPKSSPLISTGRIGSHKIQGIGANFIPENYDASLIDKVMTASDNGAIEQAKMLAKTEGVLVGISSGAALEVAIKIAKENQGKNIVVIMPDSADRYYSTDLFKE